MSAGARAARFLMQENRRLLRNVVVGATSALGIYAIATRSDFAETSTAPRRLREHFDVYFERLQASGKTCRTVFSSFANHSKLLLQQGGLMLVAMHAIADSTATAQQREVVVLVGGSLLLDWLLHHADHAAADSGLQQAAAQALIHMLDDDVQCIRLLVRAAGTASALLGRPGAVPRLLQLLNHKCGPDGTPLERALSNALPTATFPLVVPLEDITMTLQLAGGKSNSTAKRLAISVLSFWASASVVNSGKVAMCGGGTVLADAARVLAAEGVPNRKLQVAVTRCMSVLARTCPIPSALQLDDWLPELMYLAADGAARGDFRVSSYALYAAATCLSTGVDLQAALVASNALPLLRTLQQQADQFQNTNGGDTLQEAIAALVAAASTAGPLPYDDTQFWTSTFLLRLTSTSTEGPRLAAAHALAGLSSPSTLTGLQVAIEWLGSLLVHLSHNATPYTAFKVLDHDSSREQDDTVKPGKPAQSTSLKSAVPVLPSWARGVAAELLLEINKQSGLYIEPPSFGEIAPLPHQAQAIAVQLPDTPLDDALLCKALQALADLVSNDTSKQRWLYSAGVLPLIERLLSTTTPSNTPSHEADGQFTIERNDACPLIQSARLLAMLSADSSVASAIRQTTWWTWLQEGSSSKDCRLRSYCTAALLHLEVANAVLSAQGVYELDLLPKLRNTTKQQTSLEHSLESIEQSLESIELFLEEVAAQMGMKAKGTLQHATHGAPSDVAIMREVVHNRLSLRDGIHLLDPSAPHHLVLAQHGVGDTSTGAPAMDVVFVHGIRGGPFATWRRDDKDDALFSSDSDVFPREQCWPSAWLAMDLPNCRLLALEYPAAASGWEGESLPMVDTANVVLDKLLDAGVGHRPLVFVCHSMGGLLMKQLLTLCQAPNASIAKAAIATSLRGAVFYSTPHHGTWLADWGWKLRFVGASPAAALAHIRPGRHLEVLNQSLKKLHDSGQVGVLSYAEGDASSLGSLLPPIMVVPISSANPGFGEFHVLPGVDHINVCKPAMPTDVSYAYTLQFLRRCLTEKINISSGTVCVGQCKAKLLTTDEQEMDDEMYTAT